MNLVFTCFGLKMAEDKTQTMIFNADEETLAQESIITLNGFAVENVRKFRYLGYWLSNTAKSLPLAEQISSAWSKWTETAHFVRPRNSSLDTSQNARIHRMRATPLRCTDRIAERC